MNEHNPNFAFYIRGQFMGPNGPNVHIWKS